MWTAVELRELRIFLALAEELHFGRTAQRLRISQPGVSEAIRSLEAHLGGRLFERTSRRVALTPAGQELRRTIGPIIDDLQRALTEAGDMAAGLSGQLRVGVTATTDVPALSGLVTAFQARHPDCQVILHEVDTWDPYRALRLGDVDVLVNWLAVDEPDLTAGPAISVHDRVLVVARGHRLAGRTVVLIEDLAGEQVLQPPPSYPPALCDAILPPRTPSGRPIVRTQAIHSVSGAGSHIAHGRIVHITMAGVPFISRDDVAFIPIQDLAPTPLGLIWCTARHSAKIRAIAGTARPSGRSGSLTRQPPLERPDSTWAQTGEGLRANGAGASHHSQEGCGRQHPSGACPNLAPACRTTGKTTAQSQVATIMSRSACQC